MAPNWEQVEEVRRALEQTVAAAGLGAELAQAVGMVGAELLENAVKYGAAEGEPVQIVVVEEDGALHTIVSNDARAGATFVTDLVERIERLQSFPEPRDAYLFAVQEVYARQGPGWLGLARILFEGQCRLRCEVTAAGRTTVRASRPLSMPEVVAR